MHSSVVRIGRMVLTYSDPSDATGETTEDSDIVEARTVGIVPGERVVCAVDFVSGDPAHAGPMIMNWESNGHRCGNARRYRCRGRPGRHLHGGLRRGACFLTG